MGTHRVPHGFVLAGYQAWDMSDPAEPRFLDQFAAPGQRFGDQEAYKKNPRGGNRTSWFGARMPLFVPTPAEEGGKYGYGAMAGLGLYVLDISNPGNMKAVGHLEFPPNVAGTEGDNIDVSQVEKTGIIYYSGYPLAESCYEPYKDIYAIDVSDPTNPRIVATLPRPTPPTDAPFTDFCQRRGSFGPKRTGYYTQPGTPRDGIVPYAFYNAGVQIFDVNDPEKAEIVAYFVPRFSEDVVEWAPRKSCARHLRGVRPQHHLALYQPWILCALDSGSWRAEIERARDSLAATLMTDCALASYK